VQTLPHPAPIHRPTSSRHRHVSRLSSGSNAPIIQKANTLNRGHSNPSSQVSSPTTAKSPEFGIQGGINLPHAGFQAQQQLQQLQQPVRNATFPGISQAATRPGLQPIAPNPGGRPGHWPSPFQTHNEQLGKLTLSLPLMELCRPRLTLYRTRIRQY
jgi:hypothetical protein